ncbi:MAG: endo-1,4-beta-xylanase [Sphingobium sp.]
MITRRNALTLLGCGAVQLLGRGTTATPSIAQASSQPLRQHAARKGMDFGLAVIDSQVLGGGRLMKLVAREADMIVPANALKWGYIEKQLGRPDYGPAERALAFAEKNSLRLRGHAAFWFSNIPPEIRQKLGTKEAPSLFLDHASAIVSRYRGRIFEWDVLNEAIFPQDGAPGDLRRAPFGLMDYGYYAELFSAVHQADPAARLYYNDFKLEGDSPGDERRRKATLQLLEELLKRNAPVHGLGSQSHLALHLPFQPAPFRAFLSDVAAMGLEIRITEFDVSDSKSKVTDIGERDRQIAARAKIFLDTAFDERAVKGLLCWGVNDGDSFYNQAYCKCGRADGKPMRPLPFDDHLQRKPLWNAIAAAFDGAPAR